MLWLGFAVVVLGVLFFYILPTYFVPRYLVQEDDGVYLRFWFVNEKISAATTRPPVPDWPRSKNGASGGTTGQHQAPDFSEFQPPMAWNRQ